MTHSRIVEALEDRRLLAYTPYQWPGEADASVPTMRGPAWETWQAVAVQADGKFLVAGNYDLDSRLRRYRADGTIDTDFAGDGNVILDLGPSWEGFEHLFVQEDGRILAVGFIDNGSGQPNRWRGAYVRLMPDGTPDTTFGGGDGLVIHDAAGFNWLDPTSVALLDDGRILALSDGNLVARLGADGSLDTTFGTGGFLTLAPTRDDFDGVKLLALEDGGFYAIGYRHVAGGGAYLVRVGRLKADGTPDPTFGSGGWLEIDVTAPAYDAAYDMPKDAALRPDGRLLLALSSGKSGSTTERRGEVRQLLPSGAPDTSFGVNGLADVSAYLDPPSHLAIDSQGRVVVAGTSAYANPDVGNRNLIRLTAAGALDDSFGIGGRAIRGASTGVALEADDDIISLGGERSSLGPSIFRVLGNARGDGPVFLDDATGVLHVTGTLNGDELTLAATTSQAVVTVNGHISAFPLGSVTSLDVDASYGEDHIVYDVGDAFAGATSVINAGPTRNVLNIPSGVTNRVEIASGPSSGTVRVLRPSGVSYATAVTVQAAGTADVTVDANQSVSLVGTAGDDSFDWTFATTTAGGTTVHGNVNVMEGGAGNDTFRLRATNRALSTRANGGAGDDVLDALTGSLIFDGGVGVDRFALVPATAATASTGFLNATSARFGTTTVTHTAVEQVTVTGSSGKDSFTVDETPAGMDGWVELGAGADTLGVGNDPNYARTLRGIRGKLVLDLGTADPTTGTGDTLTVSDAGFPPFGFTARPARFTVTDSTIIPADDTLFGSPSAAVDFRGAEVISVVGGSLGDDITVVPSPAARFDVSGANPTTAPGDGLAMTLSGTTTATFTAGTAAGSGRYDFSDRQPVTFSLIERVTLDVADGAHTFSGALGAGTVKPILRVGPAAGVTLTATQVLSALEIASGGSVAVAGTSGGDDKAVALVTAAISLAADARLDLRRHDLIIDYAGTVSPIGTASGGVYGGVIGLVQSGRNGGAWDGDGIRTSASEAAGGLTTLGVAEAATVLGLQGGQTAAWNDVTVDATSVIVKYTYAGDANLDGIVSGDDYSAIDFGILVPDASGWPAGDFNLDGKVTGDDYADIDFAMLAQGAPL
jgi:uncharacterized delta-60 repeat protein